MNGDGHADAPESGAVRPAVRVERRDVETRFRSISRAAMVLAVAACATGGRSGFPADRDARPATDTPAAFTFSVPASGDACRSPAVDPRDGTRLVLARSSGGRGDYEVPAGRYGVNGREYLRLDCATGAVVGAVPR